MELHEIPQNLTSFFFILAEKDPEKKAALTAKVAEYTKRAEELKSVLQPQPVTSAMSTPVPRGLQPVDEPDSSFGPAPSSPSILDLSKCVSAKKKKTNVIYNLL